MDHRVISPVVVVMRVSLEACMFKYLVPVGEIVWKGLGSVALLKEVCYWGSALRFQKTCPISSVCLPCGCVSRCKLLPQHHDCYHAPAIDAHGL